MEIVRGLLSPDPEIVWFPFALRKATRIIRKHGIQVMIVTAPPFSLFVLGNALKRRFPGVRYISDFRDDWLRFFLGTFDFHSSAAIRKQAARIERETVSLSDAVLHVTAMLSRETRERYPEQPSSKFHLIPNGYDPEVFAGFRSRPHTSPNVIITYVGTVYKTTSPGMYFDALDGLPEEMRSQIETRFVGRITDEERALLEKRHSQVKFLGFVPQAQAIRYMEETDFLLVTMLDPTAATGKLYEYLATGKPILAIAPKGGEVDSLFQETGVGWCVSPDDQPGLQQMLRDAYAMARQGSVKLNRNEEAIRRYERPRLAAEFARVIESCL
jgi:glycosyltransferase involved in cell wall biosynthesis